MGEQNEFSDTPSYRVSFIGTERVRVLLDCLPQSAVRRRELDLSVTTLAPYVDLAEGLSRQLGQPLDTAIIRRYEEGDDPQSRVYQPFEAARFGGSLAMASLSGEADFFVQLGRKEQRVICTPGTVVTFDANLTHRVSPPLTRQPRSELLLGHVLSNPPAN